MSSVFAMSLGSDQAPKSGAFFGISYVCIVSPWCRASLGIIYPTFKSFEAIESAGRTDDTQWLTYWVVYSFIQIVEKLLWVVLMWVPLYSVMKTALLAWLVVPQFCGAKVLYTMFIRKALQSAANQLKDIPALEDVVKPFVSGQGVGGTVPAKKTVNNDATAVSHSVIGGITSAEKRTTGVTTTSPVES